MFHVLSAIRPSSLKKSLESDLDFSHYEFRKDFLRFTAHAVKLSEAFQLVDAGLAKSPDTNNLKQKNPENNRCENNSGSSNATTSTKSDRELPICPFGPHRSRGLHHLLKDCGNCPDEEKKELFKQLAEEKAKTGPSRSTRSQIATK